jgi:hypothetical protein
MIFKQELSTQNGRYKPFLCFHLGKTLAFCRKKMSDAIKEASYLMNLAIKELADTKFEVLLCCFLSILNLFPLTSINIFLCVYRL